MVKTKIFSIDPGQINGEKNAAIARILRNDGVIAYPTDTFYGLGANCYSESAVKKVFVLKGRDPSKPLPVVISDRKMLAGLVEEIPPLFEMLADKFWPGPLTLVLRASKSLPSVVLGGTGSIGVRYPDFPWLQALVREAKFPLTATSANLSNSNEINDPSRLVQEFAGKIDLIVDGGPVPACLPSTVLDLTSGKVSVLREGAVPASALGKFLK